MEFRPCGEGITRDPILISEMKPGAASSEEDSTARGQIQLMFRSLLRAADDIVRSYEDVALQAMTAHTSRSHRAVLRLKPSPEENS